MERKFDITFEGSLEQAEKKKKKIYGRRKNQMKKVFF